MGTAPPPFWTAGRRTGAALAFAASAGALLGLGGFTFLYARGHSYLTDDPAACANCHVMRGHYDAWSRGSHRAAATCNDCHTPSGLVPKYAVKASNGFWHSLRFTTGDHPEVIRIRPSNLGVVDAACIKCHADISDQVRGHGAFPPGEASLRGPSQVGHAR